MNRCPLRGWVPVLAGWLILVWPFGSAAQTLIAKASTWRYGKGTREASDPRSEWRTLDFDDASWPKGNAPLGYGTTGLNTTFGDMPNTYTTFFLRKTFTVSGLDAATELRASVKYDDGFILWINGERVLDKNEPDGTPLYDSTAAANGGSDGLYETCGLPDPQDYLELGENVVAIQVFNASKGSSDCHIDVELASYKKVSDTKFSHDRGFYDASFDLTITTATPGATIRYTTDGSPPTSSSGTASVGSATVHITTTTCLRAAAFKGGHEPTNVDTHTYIFLDDVLRQPNNPAGFPATWCGVGGANRLDADYQMDPEIVTNSLYQANLRDNLRALPTLSVVMKQTDLFGSTGIYRNGGGQGDQNDPFQRPASLELFHPAGGRAGFQIDCGIKPRSWLYEKRPFTLYFQSEYGPTKLRYPFFEDAPLNADSAADEFDRLVLRGDTAVPGCNTNALWQLTDEFERDSQMAISSMGVHGTFMHLYLNGLYWGVYSPVELPTAWFSSSYGGGDMGDWFAGTGGNGIWYEHLSGDDARWLYLMNTLIDRPMDVGANYTEMCEYLDAAQYADYIALRFYTGMGDWCEHRNEDGTTRYAVNNYFVGNRNLPGPRPIQYFCFDGELSWTDYYKGHEGAWIKPAFTDEIYPNGASTLKWVAGPLRAMARSADFRTLFADRVYKHGYNDGALTDANSQARWATLAAHVEGPMVAESARWGDHWRDFHGGTPVWTRNPHFYHARDRIRNLMAGNSDRLRAALRSTPINGFSLYPNLDPPGLHRHGGAIASGFKLTMSNPNSAGNVYYTLDGSDPRKPGGTRCSRATLYGGPVALSRTTHVKARVYKTNNTWSALHEATYNCTAHYGNIRITEIMYNPLGGGAYEFVEIRNTGSSTRGLSAMRLRGLRYTFPPGTDLAGGEFLVIASDAAAFEQRHGFAPFGQYDGGLDNGGERIALLDCDGHTVTSVRYNDKDPWPKEADGDGFSLVFEGAGEQDDPAKWRVSNLIGGSPGRDDGPYYRVVINEALTHTDPPEIDAIELRNLGDDVADIGGWYLSDTVTNYTLYPIPAGKTIPAGGYAAFNETQLGFALDSHGDQIYLTHWDTSGNLLYMDRVEFGAAENGIAFGRHVKTTGGDDFAAQSAGNTLGDANAYPRVGPIVINEIMYNPMPGEPEFVELYNAGGSPVKLYDPANPANTWRLTNAVDYVFPQGITVDPGEYVLVSSTNASALRSAYPDVPAEAQVFGPYTGRLGNGGESVRLVKPDTPDTEGIPWIEVDRVSYQDNDPWPERPDGDGPSLERIAASLYGNDPANWAASRDAGGTPGRPNSGILVSKTAAWRYHHRGQDLDTAWRNASFDDSRWPDGNAPLGYGYPEIDTEVPYGDNPADKHITTYLRTRFMLGVRPAQVSSLTLAAKYDDGFVAYLNGQEIMRAAMAAGTIAYDTTATGHSAVDYEEFGLNAHIGKLILGVNVLAVELHQTGPSSSDLFLDLELRHTAQAANPPAAPSGLTAQSASTSRINLAWQDNSNDEQGFKIDRRQSGTSTWARVGTVPANATAFSDTGLPAGTHYYYRVKAYNGDGDSDYSDVASAATTLAPLTGFTAYNDLAWFAGQRSANITAYTTTNAFPTGVDGGPLVDHATGASLGVQLTVRGGSAPVAQQGLDPAAGTDAHDVFGGVVDGAGTVTYGDQDLTLAFSGLDPTLRYALVLYGDRNRDTYVGSSSRYQYATLQGAVGFENASTTGTTILTDTTGNDTTRYNAGYNNPVGYVTRFTNIDPGADGAIVLRVKRDSASDAYTYANALMLRGSEIEGPEWKVPEGAIWKYRKGTAEASRPSTAWRGAGFDDSGWASGPAPIGYGAGEATTLDDMQTRYSSVFLRKAFSVRNSALINELRLWAHHDDGFIMWINGEEVARVNVAGTPGSFVACDACAAENLNASWSNVFTGADMPALREGDNVLAVQVFNRSLDSGDLLFDGSLAVGRHALPAPDDVDQDGMPDAWESACLARLSDPADRTASADPDNDGMSNLDEFVAGTDPTADAQYFGVDLAFAGGGIVVTLPTIEAAGSGYAGYTRYYALETKDGMDDGAWSAVPGCERISGAGQTIAHTNSTGRAQEVYRGRVWLE
ncbi:MAG: lamin tail domain-containing protein [Kiritimatiellae bacterium]|nr:lamin tail domain-containing protein [Kiritimatiellia bacterium]